jgi:hypothetical protein
MWALLMKPERKYLRRLPNDSGVILIKKQSLLRWCIIVAIDEDESLLSMISLYLLEKRIEKEELGTKKITDIKVETGKVITFRRECTKEINHKEREERHAKGTCCYRNTGSTAFFLIIRFCL